MLSSYDVRVLEEKLGWNIYVVSIYPKESERIARSNTDETQVDFIAFDEAHQEVPAEEVKRSVWHSLTSGGQSLCRQDFLEFRKLIHSLLKANF